MSLLKGPFGKESSTARTATRLVRVAAAQRIRMGLTGLAAVFLLVLVAAVGLRPAPAARETTSEPLAMLGVAPGAGPAAESLAPATATTRIQTAPRPRNG